MALKSVAALALTFASSLHAQTAPPAPAVDYSYATPLPGSWSYVRAAPDATQAVFRDSTGRTQLTLICTRSTRRVRLSKPASAAAPSLFVWTSSAARSVPAAFTPATAQVSAELYANDPLLDGIGFSRGRFGVSVAGAPALVVPAWAEPARIVEDCRS